MTLQRDSEMKVTPATEQEDFSLVLGGPLFQLCRRAHLSGNSLELTLPRVLVITMFAWLPLLLLSVLDGHFFRGASSLPFLYDIETNVRFLIALPLLIVAEVTVHLGIGPLVHRFVETRIVAPEDLPSFNAAVGSAHRVRNSLTAELALLVLVYTVGLWIWRSQIALGTDTWYAKPNATHLHLTAAGYWFAFVSIPIFQFLLLRWYMRMVLWFRFLWRVSRLHLRLTAAHPDRAGGIGFLGRSSYSFGPVLLAQGSLLAGLIASRVLYEGRNLLSFKMEATGYVCLFVLFIVGPLLMFTPQLSFTKWIGLAQYGLLANRYVFGFEDKWIRGGAMETGELLGTGDLQSLADMGNSYVVVGAMRIIPIGLDDVMRLVAITAAPLIPLVLTTISLEDLLTRLIKILF